MYCFTYLQLADLDLSDGAQPTKACDDEWMNNNVMRKLNSKAMGGICSEV